MRSIIDFHINKAKNSQILFQEDFSPFYPHYHRHKEVQVSLFLQDCNYIIADQIGELKSGDLLVLGSHIPHLFSQEEKPNQEGQTLMLSIFLADSVAKPSLYDFEEFQFLKSLVESSETPFILRPSSKFINDFKSLYLLGETSRLLQMLQILNRVKKYPQRKIRLANKVRVNEKEGKRLNAIIQFMLNSNKQTLSFKEVSEVANLTPTSFCRFFKKHTNKSFGEFYRELKMQKVAQSLIYNPNIPIQDIAFKSGYFTISSFNRNFKQVFGRSPSAYKKLHSKN